jgi:hypothetical protein
LNLKLGYGGYYGNDKIAALTFAQAFLELPYNVFIYQDALKYFVFADSNAISEYIFNLPGNSSVIQINHAGKNSYVGLWESFSVITADGNPTELVWREDVEAPSKITCICGKLGGRVHYKTDHE